MKFLSDLKEALLLAFALFVLFLDSADYTSEFDEDWL